MSSPKSHTIESVRRQLVARMKDPDFNMRDFERQLGGKPTRQALKKFAEGEGGASFWKRVGRLLRGEPDVLGLVEEAEAALRLIREAEAAMLRVTERLRQLPPDADITASIEAADAPMPTAQRDVPKVRRKAGGTG